MTTKTRRPARKSVKSNPTSPESSQKTTRKSPEQRLCEAADKAGISPRDAVEFPDILKTARLKSSQITESLIAAAEKLERDWSKKIRTKVEGINKRTEIARQKKLAEKVGDSLATLDEVPDEAPAKKKASKENSGKENSRKEIRGGFPDLWSFRLRSSAMDGQRRLEPGRCPDGLREIEWKVDFIGDRKHSGQGGSKR